MTRGWTFGKRAFVAFRRVASARLRFRKEIRRRALEEIIKSAREGVANCAAAHTFSRNFL